MIASDLAREGDEVHGYDPSPVPTPRGVERHDRPGRVVEGCALILAVTPGSEARAALDGALDDAPSGAIYADLSTGAPGLKEELDTVVSDRGLLFADVALMSPVPGRGLSAPALVSGKGAMRYAELMNERGGNVEVIGTEAGEAARRKLLRSVVTKGLAALLIESVEAAQLAGRGDWLWDHLVSELTSMDAAMLRRLRHDTAPHARRRLDEMRAAREMLVELGAPALMTTATIAQLERILDGGTPDRG